MKYHILAFGAGFLLDQIFGDPYFLPHPIRGIGWLIAKTEKALRSGNPQEASPEREAAERRQAQIERQLINTGAQVIKRGILSTLFGK